MILCSYMLRASLVLFFLSLPEFVFAAGLVPCGGTGEPACETCHFVQLINSVSGWLVTVLGIVAAIIIVVAGLYLATSAGNQSAMSTAKKLIINMFIGYVIVLAGFLMINLILRALLTDANYQVWNQLQCTVQTVPQVGRITASGSNGSVATPAAVAAQVSSIASSGSLQTDITNAANAAGITDSTQINNLRALIAQESSNCANRVGPPTSQGRAYGCGQITLPRARELDPSLRSMSDADAIARLQNDNIYNLSLSARNYSELLSRYNGDTNRALAAYNGGPGANAPSNDCPGLMRWQCVWDSPGCYGTSDTSCRPNIGYIETRNYVTNITAVARGL